ncbi:Ropporin-1-like protein [Atta colombica]|uniref:Ropporin-1-like protein n=1 Tax=Atta colombica TaxID=520822 RepID=A0A151I016_9HYME|nr:Ropporin-1-like protein [Atta colombica]
MQEGPWHLNYGDPPRPRFLCVSPPSAIKGGVRANQSNRSTSSLVRLLSLPLVLAFTLVFPSVSSASTMSDSQTKRIYCAQQINIPSTFPHILRLYAKAAIRTQPNDLLRWTAMYFRALANGEVPPAKDRLEYPSFIHPSGITPGYLKTVLNRFGHVNKVCLRALLLDCQGLDLPEMSLYRLFIVAGLLEDKEYCDFYRFLAVACGFLGNNLLETMIYVCELLTHEPNGGSAMIPLRIFLDLYGYLADLDCSGERRKVEHVDSPCNTATSVLKPSSTYQEEARSSDEDVCGKALREKQPSESLEIWKDYGDDPEHSDIDIVLARQFVASDKTEIEIESIDGHVLRGGTSEPAVEMKFKHLTSSIIDHNERNSDNSSVDVQETTDDAFEFNSESEEKRLVREAIDYEIATTLIDLKNSSEICQCRSEPESDQTPSPDPLKEFLKRMQAEIEAGRLETIFRVSGIGPPVSSKRVTVVGLWLTDCARRQEGLVGPRNIRHFLCPNLDDIIECDSI